MKSHWMYDWMLQGRLLPSAKAELERALCLAQKLARATDRLVTLAPEPAPGRLSPTLPRGLKWGKPAKAPLPPGTLDPRWAEAPRPLTVTPWGTATEAMWFLHDGRRALCLHLSAKGETRLLSYRAWTRTWAEA